MSALSQLTEETNFSEAATATATAAAAAAPAPAQIPKMSFLAKSWTNFKFGLNLIYTTFGIYFLWICIHYFAVQLYVHYCAQSTFYGFLISPFLASAVHCKALNWAIYNSSNIIDHMWILLGTWICSKILIRVATTAVAAAAATS